jgi:hypothetical protein
VSRGLSPKQATASVSFSDLPAIAVATTAATAATTVIIAIAAVPLTASLIWAAVGWSIGAQASATVAAHATTVAAHATTPVTAHATTPEPAAVAAVSAAPVASAFAVKRSRPSRSTGSPRSAFTRLVHRERASVEQRAVHRLRGLFGGFRCRHFDKPEAARAAGHLVEHHACRSDRAVRGKRCAQLLITDGVREVSDIQALSHDCL